MREKTIYPFADTGTRYTMVDNYLFDNIMPSIKPNSWKVLSFILRKTTGWHKGHDQLSYSQIREGTGISSQSTVQVALRELVERTLIIQQSGATKWEAFTYSLNRSFTATISVSDENEPSTEIVTGPSTEIVTEPSTVSVNTKETSKETIKDKQPTANAVYSHPISLLSEKEIKNITKGKHFKLYVWETWLTDETAERNRAGVLKFLDGKIGKFQLLPDTPAAHTLFEKLAVEYDAKGRRPPDSFPNLAIKQNFDKAVGDLNGRFDEAITKALEANITSIPRIVKYISSANWRNDINGQQTSNVSSGGQTQGRSPQPGNGRTPEMQARLEAAHASDT